MRERCSRGARQAAPLGARVRSLTRRHWARPEAFPADSGQVRRPALLAAMKQHIQAAYAGPLKQTLGCKALRELSGSLSV